MFGSQSRVSVSHEGLILWVRPLGQGQLYGSWLPVRDDLLPEYPDDRAQQDAEAVAQALTASYPPAGRAPVSGA